MKKISNIVLVRHSKRWGLDEKMVVRLANEVLSELGYKKGVELSIFFVGRTKAKRLNAEYRRKDYIPQVLGFPMSKETDSDGLIRLGDVVICNEKLKYEAEYQKSNAEKVLSKWLKHGVENLLI